MDYRELLKEHLEDRKSEQPKYSTRSFAKDLGVSPAYISLILNGQRKLAEDRAGDIAARLEWPAHKQRLFCTLVRYEHARTDAARRAIQDELDQMQNRGEGYDQVQADTFRMISKWYHNALMELVRLPTFDPSPVWIAKRLGVTPIEAELALDRLQRLGFLKRDKKGKFERADGKWEVEEIPSAAIRGHHVGMLKRAALGLEQQDMDSRDFSGLTLAINSEKLPEAKALLKNTLREICDMLNTGDRDAVYQISYQMFRLDRPERGKDGVH